MKHGHGPSPSLPSAPSLRQALAYTPVELEFGTSGLRGLVKDITDLEAYVAVRGFLGWLADIHDASPGGPVCLGGDLRPSTPTVMEAACRAVLDAGFTPMSFGRIPTPALLWAAMKRGAPGVMVTGSHIPFDRNGIKLTRKTGEILKRDEGPIRAAVRARREAEYERPFVESMFDEHGALRPGARPMLPPEPADPVVEYVERYLRAFPRGVLSGCRVLVYEHSSVCRDVLSRVLRELDAEVIPAGRSDTFVAVDTEAVNADMLAAIQALVDANGGSAIDAVVSTDGDGDRPLVLGVEEGKVRFYPGDILGIIAADFLAARHVAVPVSVNDAVDMHMASRGVTVVKTRIGSPYVIEAMREVGWEANGGFLTAAPFVIPGGGKLEALPTRDALLPILSALFSAVRLAGRGSRMSLSALFSRLPSRFGRSALVRPFAQDRGRAIVSSFSPTDETVVEARLSPNDPSLWSVRRKDGTTDTAAGSTKPGRELFALRDAIERCFTAGEGFSSLRWVNWLDGVRMGFANGDIAHVRPSGNAPELRLYAVADTARRAEEIAALAGAEPGPIQRMEKEADARMDREADTRRAVLAFRASPAPLLLEGAVQSYAWGGFRFIPELLGRDNPKQTPQAELWIGAHPVAPSVALIGESRIRLDRLMAEAAAEVLGPTDDARFGGRLPFLLKVLDARTVLSVQAHPSKEQAAAGFARENAAGIPLDSPSRTYRDDNHKPEAHACLSELWMLHGFRPLEEIARVLEEVPELGRIMPDFEPRLGAARRDPGSRSALLRDLYTRVMTMPQPEVDAILDPLLSRLETEEKKGALDKDGPDFWVLRASRQVPLPGGHRDRGLLSMYLMNLLHLHPGQCTYQPAGTLHAYLEGTTVELMANSDNVLRGGLTPKTVDTAELLRIVSFTDGHPPVLSGRMIGEGVRRYETTAAEFVLERIDLAEGRPTNGEAGHSAECLITISGSAVLASGACRLSLGRGAAALIPAGLAYSLAAASDAALLFRAGIPRPGVPRSSEAGPKARQR